ncbi:hypothetical protein MUB15_03490 [Priestia sp. OVS21]|nr:hypothetical protein [Priestia sp. OVS21]
MNKNTMIKTLKVISVVSLLALLFIIAYDRSMSTSMIILFSSLIFFVFVLSDFFRSQAVGIKRPSIIYITDVIHHCHF